MLSQPRRPAAKFRVEQLEDRVTPSWGGIPPSTISLPASSLLTLNSSGDTSGTAAITNDEIDWFRFTLNAGTTNIATTTPSSNLDTVIGLYNSSGQRVAYNDDLSSTNTDSHLSAILARGTYYLGITNYDSTSSGSYTLFINGPSDSPPIAPPPPPPPPPPISNGFGIQVRVSGLTVGQQNAFLQAANRWAQVITGDLSNELYNGVAVDDVLIDASAVSIDGAGGVLGQAGPDRFRSGSFIPYHGTMQFDTADLAALEANGQLTAVVLHEMGHVLGIGTIWEDRGFVSGAGTSNPRFVGAQATAQYNAIFGRNETSVPVENSGGSGTADSHWRDSIFGNEVMTGYVNSGFNPLSRITLGSLADLGYQVNYSAADIYTPPGASLVARGVTGGSSGIALRTAEPIISIALAFDASVTNRIALPGLTNVAPLNRSRTYEASAFESLDHLTRGIRVDAPTTSPAMRTSVPMDMLLYLEDSV